MNDFEKFQSLSVTEVARIVREAGPKVCGFPINGTRRWFALEYPELAAQGGFDAYLQIAGQRHLAMYRLFFDHGVDTLLTPIFGPAVADRGDSYKPVIAPAFLWLTAGNEALNFFDAYEVRVRFYGDVEHSFEDPATAPVLEAFAALTRQTARHTKHRLFIGVGAHDPTEAVAKIAVQFYQAQGRLPNKRQIIEAYYGDYVESLSFCIGFEPMAMFDLPLVASGMEDLYFTVSPSLYLDDYTLRAILYDHLYARRTKDNYPALKVNDWSKIGRFYNLNRQHVMGIGRQDAQGCWWYPLPQVELPRELGDNQPA